MRGVHEWSVDGRCTPQFAGVRDAFTANFADLGEVGGAVCVAVDGEVVVDLTGGWADVASRTPWGPDTIVNVFSVGKGMAAVCAARLAGLGLLDPRAPVRQHWPEFGAAGKEEITVADVLSHRAGLPAIGEALPPEAVFDWDTMVGALARTAPWWEPGTAHGYHVNTFGFLVGELVRRITGASLRDYFAAEVAGPLAADVHYGVPVAEEHRVADLLWDMAPPSDVDPGTLTRDQRMGFAAYFNPVSFSGAGYVNGDAWRRAEIPSANAHASARGVARVYAALAAGGTLAGVTVVDRDALRTAVRERSCGEDLILHRPSRFGLGFQLTQPERPLGPGPSAFGHFGAGGSLGFCDPDAGLAFGYVMSQMGARWRNPRNRALVDAVYRCLAAS